MVLRAGRMGFASDIRNTGIGTLRQARLSLINIRQLTDVLQCKLQHDF
jgi:hypothetical protein